MTENSGILFCMKVEGARKNSDMWERTTGPKGGTGYRKKLAFKPPQVMLSADTTECSVKRIEQLIESSRGKDVEALLGHQVFYESEYDSEEQEPEVFSFGVFADPEWAYSNCHNVSEAFVKLLQSEGVEASFVSFLDEGEGWSHVAVSVGEGDDRVVVDWTYNQFSSAMWGADEPGETHPLVMPFEEYVDKIYGGPGTNLGFPEDVQFREGSLSDIASHTHDS